MYNYLIFGRALIYLYNLDSKMEEYNTKEKDVLKILVEVATAKREAEIVSNTSTAINVIFILGIL